MVPPSQGSAAFTGEEILKLIVNKLKDEKKDAKDLSEGFIYTSTNIN